MSFYDSMFGSSSNPYDAAKPYLNQMPSYIDKYMNPYINMGQTAGNIAQTQYGQMAQDPSAYYNSIFQSYEPSDYYKYMSDQLGKTQSATAAAGGFSGTESDINNQMTTKNALMSKDWQDYLNNLLNIQGTGLQGEQQMYTTGYGASNNALDQYMKYLMGSAGMAYGSTNYQNQMNNAQNQAIMSAATSALGML